MWKTTFVLCCFATSTCLASSDQTRFTVDFFKGVYEPSENAVLSPLSLQVGLSMMHHVATPEAARTMQEVLHIPGDTQEVTRWAKNLLMTINGQSKAVSMLSKVYYPRGANLNPAFVPHIQDTFKATTEEVNFAESDSTAQRVNTWVNESTRGAIRKLVTPDDISERTTSLLVNVVTLKAAWGFSGEIREKLTKKRTFHFLNGDHEVDMMKVEGELPHLYLPDLKLDAFELSYDFGTDLAMVILLPRNDTTLEATVGQFTVDHYRKLDKLTNDDQNWGNVELGLPRFTVKQKLNVESTLRKLGMGSLFDRDSFQVLVDKLSRLGHVKQSTFIKVDEKGTEAAVATSITSGRISGAWRIEANRPFLFLIRKTFTKDILFIGHYSNFEE